MLEKDFIYEQVSRLTDRLYSKTQACKQDTLLLAKKVRQSPASSSALPRPSLSIFHRRLNFWRDAPEGIDLMTTEIQRCKIKNVKMSLRELSKISFNLIP